MLLRLKPKPVNTDDANLDPWPQSEDNSNYGSLAEFRSTADIIENSLDSIRDIGNESARYRGKRPISNASLSLLPTKRTRNYTAILEPEYIITVSNVNRRKERERYRRLENKLSNIFITKEEDNI